MVHQLVFGRTQQRVAGMSAPAGAVNHALWVLDAKTDRKRLGLHEDATRVQHGKGVACAVTQRQHHLLGGEFIRRLRGCIKHRQRPNFLSPALAVRGGICQKHIGHTLLEAHLAAQVDDLLAQPLHHLDQLEGADVRVRIDQYLWRCAGPDELLHHVAAKVARVLDLAPQLAVRKSAGAALAKLHIGLGLQPVLAPQAPGVLGALAHAFTALQHDGAQPHLCEQECGEYAAGAKTHHHRARWQHRAGLARQQVGHVGRGADVRVLLQLRKQPGLLARVVQGHINNKDRQQICLAGVKAALEHLQLRNRRRFQPQDLGTQGLERGHGMGSRRPVSLCFRRRISRPQGLRWHCGQG